MQRELGLQNHVDALLAAIGDVAGLTIVDLGCGEGRLAEALAQRGAEVIGIDPNMPARLRQAAGGGHWQIKPGAADALPLPDASVDVVLFVFSLHHVPGDRLQSALSEAQRILRPAGRLYVAEPLPEGPHHQVVKPFHDETVVRAAAAAALRAHADPHFAARDDLAYFERRHFSDFPTFAARMIANMRFNGYSEADVLAPAVQENFEALHAAHGGVFDQPVRAHLYAGQISG